MRVGTRKVSMQGGEGLSGPANDPVRSGDMAQYVAAIIPIDETEPDVVVEEPAAAEEVQPADDASQYDDEW